jgi:hypothetical protein
LSSLTKSPGRLLLDVLETLETFDALGILAFTLETPDMGLSIFPLKLD